VLPNRLQKYLLKPLETDDKYSRGVVGFVTGSAEFPGAAILGVTSAIRVGVGMVRYFGPDSVNSLVLESRPEVVCAPGRVTAWVLGSGVRSEESSRFEEALADELPKVIDAGCLEVFDVESLGGVCVLTPHAGEAAKLLTRLGFETTVEMVEADPEAIAKHIAFITGQTVCLKGNITIIANAQGELVSVGPNPTDLATAGTGDVLAGIMGALLAHHAGDFDPLDIAQTAVLIHTESARRLSAEGPIAALELAEEVRSVVRDWRG